MTSIRPETRYTNIKKIERTNSDRWPKRFVIAEDGLTAASKKNDEKSSASGGLYKKLQIKKPVLTEVKDNNNTRTVAMLLRSERELLIENKQHEEEISRLKIMLMEKNTEAEKLKDLCLRQREEIKSLKSAILFPDSSSSSMSWRIEDSEVRQAKQQLIPSLQRQVAFLKGRLQSLADDVAEVKAEKYSERATFDNRFLLYDRDDGAIIKPRVKKNTLLDEGYSSSDEMILEDLNPCLTPFYAKTKSKAFDVYRSCEDNVEAYDMCST